LDEDATPWLYAQSGFLQVVYFTAQSIANPTTAPQPGRISELTFRTLPSSPHVLKHARWPPRMMFVTGEKPPIREEARKTMKER